jgi:hypothetical protein
VNASKVDCCDDITFETEILKKEGSNAAVLGTAIECNDVLQLLLDIS